jgi:hypothetical protein
MSDNIGTDLPIGAHHYRAYVGPPEKYDLMAAMQFNLITLLGLREHHFLLDIGCGSLRAGKLFIPYLQTSHYFGIEPERWLVAEGIENELGQEIVRIKKPVFGYDEHFDCGVFGQKFDFVIAQSVFSHTSQAQIRQCLSNVSACMRPTGIWVATFVKGSSDYQGREWVYPDCVTYTVEQMKRLAAESGLEANIIDWPHMNGQTWLLLTWPGNANVPSSLLSRQKASKIRQNTDSSIPISIDSPICIIGMHRSGTSMVAQLLNLCGLNLGPEDKLLGPSPNNAMGHFEHTGFLEIDDGLLKHFGGSWDNPPILNSGWEKDPSLRYLVEKAETLVETFADKAPWGWKEPRTTFLLPFWQKLLPDLRYIICIRNPLEVARSLEKRDGMSMPAAAQLWSQYTREAIQNTEGRPRIITFYEDYFGNPAGEVTRVAKFCGLEAVEEFSRAQKMISGELRHQDSGIVELLSEKSVPLECKMLYLCLRTLALEEIHVMNTDNSIQTQRVEGIDNVLQLINELYDEKMILQLETALCVKELQLGSALRDKERQLSALRERMSQELKEKANQISQLQDCNAQLQAFADAVRKSLVYRLYRKFLRPFRRQRDTAVVLNPTNRQ